MACRGRCFFATDGVHGEPVSHKDTSSLGMTWYFCPAHKTFHAFFLPEGAPQPLCGECAVLFFDRASRAIWVRQFDLPAVMSNYVEVFREARADLLAIFSENEAIRLNGDAVGESPLIPPQVVSGALGEIPRDDLTYTSLSTTLIPHTRIPNLYLLEYRTFQGALAYQPCSKDIDTSGLFKALSPIDHDKDPVFKQARAWSCIVQASPELPKELRWVLATIYNFSNEMLCPEIDECTLWQMRPWLLYWYTVADELLETFGLFASAPEADWFQRPYTSEMATPSQAMHEAEPVSPQHGTPTSSNGRTVVHHECGRGSIEQHFREGSEEPERFTYRHSHPVSVIYSWLASQPHLPELNATEIFDPTPRGYVSPKAQSAMSQKSQASSSTSAVSPLNLSSRLNPRAAVFNPFQNSVPSPCPPRKVSMEGGEKGDGDSWLGSGSDSEACPDQLSSSTHSDSSSSGGDDFVETDEDLYQLTWSVRRGAQSQLVSVHQPS